MMFARRVRIFISVVACLGLLQFLLALAYAITHYPGGYSFFGNFLSDLGRTRASGEDNMLCSQVFNRSIVALGLSLLPFFALVPSTLGSSPRRRGSSPWAEPCPQPG